MRAYLLSLALLSSVAFSFATALEPWFQGWAGNRTGSGNVVQIALGDGRKLFAKHVFTKADAYFHNGYYPTIYDNHTGYEKAHIAEDMHKEGAEEEAEENFLGKPRDWIDAFSRNFFPARHTHIGDSGGGGEREILPWLRLSAELDPERVETYVVSAYWLRKSLRKVDEAEQFLREGLQNNPRDCDILFELGCIYHEERHDPARARNLWELALQSWRERASSPETADPLVGGRILGNLASLEEKQKNFAKTLEYLAALKTVSPNPDAIQKWIDEVKSGTGRKLP